MADIIYVAVIVATFALFALYVLACERIVGPDEQAAPEKVPDESSVAA